MHVQCANTSPRRGKNVLTPLYGALRTRFKQRVDVLQARVNGDRTRGFLSIDLSKAKMAMQLTSRAVSDLQGWAKRCNLVSLGTKLVLHSSFAAVELFRPDSHSGGAFDCQGPV